MKNIFNTVKMTKPRTSSFDLSHDFKFSCNAGELIPIMCTDVVPGDRFRIGCESLVRFQPMVAPLMHRADVFMHYYFVPKRLLWDGFEDWIIGKPTAEAHPYLEVFVSEYTRLMDYLGIPTPDPTGQFETINAMAFSAYQFIYNEYYRDQNLIAEVDHKLMSGNNGPKRAVLTALRKPAWEHDYFTAALPFAQKGSTVDIPLGDVKLKEEWDPGNVPYFQTEGGGIPIDGIKGYEIPPRIGTDAGGSPALAYNPNGSLETESTTINNLRLAQRLQMFLEKAARGGTRYIEFIRSMFGVQSSDRRLQRPEYITGIKTPMMFSEVLNTTGDAGTGLPQGNMSGHGFTKVSGNYGSYFVEEFGYIMGVMFVRPKTAYQQGIPKHFLKFEDYTQHYFPDFANLGEQEVKNKEVYAYQASGDDTFGYVPRYSEYKFENNRVAGDFKTSLDFWHWGRIFGSQPHLNQAFIECDPRHDIFAVTDPDEQKVICQVYNDIRAIRPMPKFGTPHF